MALFIYHGHGTFPYLDREGRLYLCFEILEQVYCKSGHVASPGSRIFCSRSFPHHGSASGCCEVWCFHFEFFFVCLEDRFFGHSIVASRSSTFLEDASQQAGLVVQNVGQAVCFWVWRYIISCSVWLPGRMVRTCIALASMVIEWLLPLKSGTPM